MESIRADLVHIRDHHIRAARKCRRDAHRRMVMDAPGLTGKGGARHVSPQRARLARRQPTVITAGVRQQDTSTGHQPMPGAMPT
jgi:hypothetical protein